MAKIFNNWTYRNVINFLDEKGFDFYEDVGQAEIFVKLRRNGEPDKFIEIKFNRGFYSSKAMQKMIRMSGISEDEWIKCASS